MIVYSIHIKNSIDNSFCNIIINYVRFYIANDLVDNYYVSYSILITTITVISNIILLSVF